MQQRLAVLTAEVDALTDASQHDALTGLANRSLMHQHLPQALLFSQRRDRKAALLFLDLDGFKAVNDTLGHLVGDAVLKITAERLLACVRETDTVSRHGGDEFLILLSDISDAADAAGVAGKMITALAAPMRIDNHMLRLTASVGVSVYPDDGTDTDMLIGCADAAMYRAKNESPRRPRRRFDDAMPVTEPERRLGELQEANQALVLAALGAQERQAAAEQAQHRQRAFLGMLAHELRNPLAPIRNAAAAMGRVRPSEPLLPKMQALIERQVVHITRLVDDLLDVSRIQTGKLRLEFAHVDIADVVDAAVEAVRPAMDARMQRFHVHGPDRKLTVHGDAGRLIQALSNVLNNASKYTPEAGVVELRVDAADGQLVLTVSDSGIGIPASVLATIFEPFTQGAEAVSFHGGGLGIGLAVVRELVHAHGGSVRAESEGSGTGSSFVMSLPLLD